MSKPVAQKIQPIEFFGRREATNAPTVGKLSAITLKSTVKASAVGLLAIGGVRNSSNTVVAKSTTHSAQIDQANQALGRGCFVLAAPHP